MKKILAIAAIMMMGFAATTTTATAQVHFQINIGQQPMWGPTGYDYAQYYYFPDHNFYYDVMTGQYIIYRRDRWVRISQIPAGYGFNPYRAYKVVVNQHNPYAYNNYHVRTYSGYKGQWNRQSMIRDSRDHRYYANNSHPRHNEWNQRQATNVTHNGKSPATRNDRRNTNTRTATNASNSRVETSRNATNNHTSRATNVKTTGGRSSR